MVASESLNLDAPNADCKGCDSERKDPRRGEANSLRLLRMLGVGVRILPRLRLLLFVEDPSPECDKELS